MLLFYAQSWAMVHMLAMEPAYADGFPKFVAAVSGGATADSALCAIYHKTLQQVGEEVAGYVRSKRMKAHWVSVDARPGPLEMQVVAEAGKRAELALAEVLAANPETAGEAKIRLAALSARYPNEPRAKESLGFLAMDAGSEKEAQQDFADAAGANTRDPDVLFQLAHWKRARDGPSDEVIALLQRAVAADSTHYNALLELGFAAAKRDKYELAVHTLERIGQPRAEHAYVVSYLLAYCLVELREANKARSYAQHANEIASNSKDRGEVAGLLRYIDSRLPAEWAGR
jgi:tetratricopeptide (TPR) repeat protein